MHEHEQERRIDPPRTKRFSDPEAEVVWPAIMMLPEGLQHELHRRLGEHLAVSEDRSTPQGARVARAVRALREAHDLHVAAAGEGPLTVEVFRVLRERHREFGWPPDTSIRRWLGGSWNDALRAARLEAVAGGDVTIAQGGAFTVDEATLAVRGCATDLGMVPTFGEYLGWVRRPEVLGRPGRRPMSQVVFDRLFPGQGWPGALAAAGLISAAEATLPAAALPVRPSAYRFTPEQVQAALRACAEDFGSSPRSAQYIAWRAARLAADPARPLPSYNVISRLVAGVWDDALQAAGLPRLGGRGTRSTPAVERRPPRPRYSEATLREVLREAVAAKGAPFTSTAYKDWRHEQRDRDRAEGRLRQLPSYDVFWTKYGSWSEALRQLLGDEPR
jgi:hypothetical protein